MKLKPSPATSAETWAITTSPPCDEVCSGVLGVWVSSTTGSLVGALEPLTAFVQAVIRKDTALIAPIVLAIFIKSDVIFNCSLNP